MMALVRIKWLGHAGFEIELANKILLIDPWLTGNPLAAMEASDIKKTDIACVTHDHGDHLGDAVEICKRTGATFVAIYELGVFAEENGVKDVVGTNIGGTVNVKGITITMVQAFRSSTRGAPTGFVIKAGGILLTNSWNRISYWRRQNSFSAYQCFENDFAKVLRCFSYYLGVFALSCLS